MNTTRRIRAIAATCFVAFLWSTAGFLIKSINLSPLAMTSGRCIVVFLLLTPLVLRLKGGMFDKYVILGGVFYALFVCCFTISTKYTVSAVAIVMQYTAPIYVALAAVLFLHEKIYKADLISMFFVFIGMALFFFDKFAGGNTFGNVVAVFNGITFAGLAVCFRLQKDAHPIRSVYLGSIIAAVIGLPALIHDGIPDATSCIYLFLFGSQAALTFILYSSASKYLSAIETVLLPVIDPILNPVWVFLFLGEKIGMISVFGGIVVLASVVLRAIYGIHYHLDED